MADINGLLAQLSSAEPRAQVAALARLITVFESSDVALARRIVGSLPEDGRAHIVGITGPPGAGKSTLTNALALELRSREKSVAIIAVDPSSPFSQGALLGDRVRLQEHFLDPDVFMRSMSSRGQLGGLAPATLYAARLCEVAGFDTVVIETVGIGQSEVDIASLADTTVVALAPGMGDGIQAEKAGILEVADILVVNKADRPGAGQLEGELKRMVALGSARSRVAPDGGGWEVPVVRTSALQREGVAQLMDLIEKHAASVGVGQSQGEGYVDRVKFFVREVSAALVREGFAAWAAKLDGGTDLRGVDPYAEAQGVLEIAHRLAEQHGVR